MYKDTKNKFDFSCLAPQIRQVYRLFLRLENMLDEMKNPESRHFIQVARLAFEERIFGKNSVER